MFELEGLVKYMNCLHFRDMNDDRLSSGRRQLDWAAEDVLELYVAFWIFVPDVKKVTIESNHRGGIRNFHFQFRKNLSMKNNETRASVF